MRILLVEDDALLGDGLRTGLAEAGLTVDWVQDGVAADAALAAGRFEAVVLDLNLPRRGGLEVLRAARGRGDGTPVLVLTARDAIEDRVAGLDAGADDYLTKPFATSELLARLRALARRAHGRAAPMLELGMLRIDPASRQTWLGDVLLELSGREFGVLQVLLENRGRAVTRARIEEALYGWGEEIQSNAVEVHVHRLRKKIGAEWIRTMRGIGYVMPAQPPQRPGGTGSEVPQS